jgi:hypothetical protein
MILPQHFRIQAKQGTGQSGTQMPLGRLDETFHPIGVSGGSSPRKKIRDSSVIYSQSPMKWRHLAALTNQETDAKVRNMVWTITLR